MATKKEKIWGGTSVHKSASEVRYVFTSEEKVSVISSLCIHGVWPHGCMNVIEKGTKTTDQLVHSSVLKKIKFFSFGKKWYRLSQFSISVTNERTRVITTKCRKIRAETLRRMSDTSSVWMELNRNQDWTGNMGHHVRCNQVSFPKGWKPCQKHLTSAGLFEQSYAVY